jgi:hypothetical protein
MNLDQVEKIANAVLYEGYILYPYRPSSVKNQQRWNFGALCPQSYSEAQGGTEAWTMQTECLVSGTERTALDVKVRFLHLVLREVGKLETPLLELPEGREPDFQYVPSLKVGDQNFQTWQEAVEREINVANLNLSELLTQTRRQAFGFAASQKIEPLRESDGRIVGVLVRKQQAIECSIEVAAGSVRDGLFKLRVSIFNKTALNDAKGRSRDEALMRSLVSTHTILNVRDGEFISLLETPEAMRDVAASCQNVGTWPVLVGEEGARDCLLSSPIILYDYPQIAPESAGNLFDGTEIDEILTLRIMTLTDDEKHELRGADEHARRMLERTERMLPEEMMKLHGAMRTVNPKENEQ